MKSPFLFSVRMIALIALTSLQAMPGSAVALEGPVFRGEGFGETAGESCYRAMTAAYTEASQFARQMAMQSCLSAGVSYPTGIQMDPVSLTDHCKCVDDRRARCHIEAVYACNPAPEQDCDHFPYTGCPM